MQYKLGLAFGLLTPFIAAYINENGYPVTLLGLEKVRRTYFTLGQNLTDAGKKVSGKWLGDEWQLSVKNKRLMEQTNNVIASFVMAHHGYVQKN